MANIDDIRISIDCVDQTIVSLLKERFELSGKISDIKKEMGIQAIDSHRENGIIENVLAYHKKINGGMSGKCLEQIFREIITGSRDVIGNKK